MNWIKKLFSKKIKTTQVNTIACTSSRICPKCKSNGGFFFYDKGFLDINSEPFYLCENCCKKTTIEEYEEFVSLNPQEKDKKEIHVEV